MQPFSSPGGQAGAKVRFWDAQSKRTLPGCNFMSASAALGGGSWWVELKNPLGHSAPTPPVGSLVTIFPRRGYTFNTVNSSGILAEDVTIHAGGNMGFHESLGAGGNVYRRVVIARKPGSAGLMALNADGFHSDSVETGPVLEDR